MVDKKQFITLCKNESEEVYKLFCIMGKTITSLQTQVTVLNEQVKTLQEKVKNLKLRLDQNSGDSNTPLSRQIHQAKKPAQKNGKKTGR